MQAIQQTTLSLQRRLVSPNDFPNGDSKTPCFQKPTFANNVQYVQQLPSSVVRVQKLDRDALSTFLHQDVDALLISGSDVITKRALAQASRRPLSGRINHGEYIPTFAARKKHFTTLFNDPNSPVAGLWQLQLAVERDLKDAGSFLNEARSFCFNRSEQCWATLSNIPLEWCLFHVRPGTFGAVRSYRNAGTEVLISKKRQIYQLPIGDMMVWKGDRVIRRQSPKENLSHPYKRGHGFDDRLLFSLSLTCSSVFEKIVYPELIDC